MYKRNGKHSPKLSPIAERNLGVDISKSISKAMKLTQKNVMGEKGKQRHYKPRKT